VAPGSGNDYLYAAGLWIGALDASGIPHVTTATYEREFSPDFAPTNACVNLPLDQVADVREAYEGFRAGTGDLLELNPMTTAMGRWTRTS